MFLSEISNNNNHLLSIYIIYDEYFLVTEKSEQAGRSMESNHHFPWTPYDS